jgi:hypothetical protein
MPYPDGMLRRLLCAAALSLALALSAPMAQATPRWVDRGVTMRSDLGGAIDAGFGFGHADFDGVRAQNGVGFNVEGVLGIQRFLDVGVRIGLRVNDESAAAQADYYARERDRETYRLLGFRTFANPELRVRAKVLDTGPFELALEGRVLFPVSNGTGLVLGAPMAVHLGHAIRLDTGVFMPIGFTDNVGTYVAFSVPLRVWFQASEQVWLGPMFGLRINSTRYETVDLPLGFGLGVSVHKYIDVKGDFFFNRINDGARQFGFGIGVGFYFQ